jgi:hypothetical protein
VFLDFLNTLHQNTNLIDNLVAIGISIADNALMPGELENFTFEQFIRFWDQHYQANFRNGDVGHKTTTKVGDEHYKIVLDQNILPDDLEYEVLYGFAKRFLPPHTHFTVWYDEDVPSRDQGGEQTIIHISWE